MPKSTKTTQSTTTRTRTRKSSTTIPTTTPTPILSSLSLSHAEIAHRAYELFLAGGATHGRDLEHWLQAESELREQTMSVGA